MTTGDRDYCGKYLGLWILLEILGSVDIVGNTWVRGYCLKYLGLWILWEILGSMDIAGKDLAQGWVILIFFTDTDTNTWY